MRGGERDEGGGRKGPPEATDAEVFYLHKNKEARTSMVVHLDDGEVVHGVIEYYDRDMIKINRPEGEGPNLFIRKSRIRYMHKDE